MLFIAGVAGGGAGICRVHTPDVQPGGLQPPPALPSQAIINKTKYIIVLGIHKSIKT
jgi:hypothetical protein